MEHGIVDAHQHVWRVGLFDYPWMPAEGSVLCRSYLPEDAEPLMRVCGVKRVVLVQASNSRRETDWMLEAAREHPFIAGVVGWVDLTGDGVGAELDRLQHDENFKGVRHLVEAEPDDWLTRASVLGNLSELARRGLTYDLLVHTRHLEHVRAIADRCPELRMVVDHMAKPPIRSRAFDEWARTLERVAEIENVWCKLSGLVTEADHEGWAEEDLRPYADHALAVFGARRLMFGSDYPVCLLAASYRQTLDASRSLTSGLNDEEKRRVYAGTATEFYKLKG